MVSSPIFARRAIVPWVVALVCSLASLTPVRLHAQTQTYLSQVRVSPAGTLSIYASSSFSRREWRALVLGTVWINVDKGFVDAEASRSGGAYVLTSATSTAPERVTRYRATGTLDTLYGSRGVLTLGGAGVAAARLHEAPSGHLYVLGAQLARYTPSGQSDMEFATRPAATVCPTGMRPRDLYADAEGALVLCAGSTSAFVARITAEGDIRADYGNAGRAAVASGTDGRLYRDQAGKGRVHTWSSGVFSVSALDPAGQPIHPPVVIPESPGSTFVFDDGTTWKTSTFSYPRAVALGMRGVTPDGQSYGPWPVVTPMPTNGPLVRAGATSAILHYGYISGTSDYFYSAHTRTLDLQSAPSPSPAPDLVSPVDGVVEVPTATLVWRRVPGAVGYDVSFESYDASATSSGGISSLEPAVKGTTSDTTLTLPITLLSNNRWAWRVRSRGADGRAGAWSTFATFGARFARPTLVTHFGGRRVTSPVSLIWEDVPESSQSALLSYNVSLSRSRTFATSVWDDPKSYGTPTATTPTLPDGLYYWRVLAMARSAPFDSPYSDLDSFVVAPANGLEALPEAPVAASVAFPLWLSWSAATDATAYDWQVSSTSGFETIADSGRSTAPRVEAHVPGGAYFWRVRGRSGTDVGAFSAPAPFSVAPTAPVLQAIDALTWSPVTVAWQASAGAERYRVHIRSSNTLVLDSLVSMAHTSITVPLAPQRSYTVTVAAESGATTVWSAPRSFTTQGTVSAEPPASGTGTVRIAPNPAPDDLVVRHASADALRYELVTVLGAVVARGELPEGTGETTIARDGLSPGVYVLRVFHPSQPAQALRVVLL